MKLTTVQEIYKEREKYMDKEVTVGGWVRSVRDSKTFGFIVLHDGSFFETLQVVYHDTMENFAEISKLNVGAAIIVKGTLVATPQAKQPFEIQAAEVTVEGNSAPDYPLQKKRHSLEYLRTITHLRPRTNTFQAVFRVRSLCAYAIHRFFQEQGVELAPGPKELMNMQRFYLYLNMTKPGEKLILSYSDTNAKGEGISPAYLIGSIRNLYPKLEIEGGAGVRPHKNSINNYCYPENPEAGINLFLEKLVQETEKEHEDILEQADETDAMFGELYSWYLSTEAGTVGFCRKTKGHYQPECGEGIIRRGFTLQCYQTGTFCSLCICTFPSVWNEAYRACGI